MQEMKNTVLQKDLCLINSLTNEAFDDSSVESVGLRTLRQDLTDFVGESLEGVLVLSHLAVSLRAHALTGSSLVGHFFDGRVEEQLAEEP